MKYNVRDAKTGRFVKKAVAIMNESKCCQQPRNPKTGRFVKKEDTGVNEDTCSCCCASSEANEEIPNWKIEFDKQMAIFRAQMDKFNESMALFRSTIFED